MHLKFITMKFIVYFYTIVPKEMSICISIGIQNEDLLKFNMFGILLEQPLNLICSRPI